MTDEPAKKVFLIVAGIVAVTAVKAALTQRPGCAVDAAESRGVYRIDKI